MEFLHTSIKGVIEIRPTAMRDDRGHFVRTFCEREWAAQGLEQTTKQMALSHNLQTGTLRGLHYIPEAEGEAKLVRCVRGRIFDVAVDMRPGSATFGKWTGLELSADNLTALYIPRGVAHGFITLEPMTDVAYQFSEFHRPGTERGIRWNDPEIEITWPTPPSVISERDRTLPMLRDLEGQQ
jgi:dTDP-4-dehydrorhamnose 3,5-epimerase